MKKPPQSSTVDIPGARSRWDDFLGTHIINADDVHFTVRPHIIRFTFHLLTPTGRILPLPPSTHVLLRPRASDLWLERWRSLLGLGSRRRRPRQRHLCICQLTY